MSLFNKARTDNPDEARWREQLSEEQYKVLREKGTERPFTGEYVHTKDDGIYRCAACGAELFSSDTKFDSGTGWPSFTDPAVAENVELHEDNSHVHAAHRGHLRELRRPPRPRVPRRPQRLRPLLHQLGLAEAGPERATVGCADDPGAGRRALQLRTAGPPGPGSPGGSEPVT